MLLINTLFIITFCVRLYTLSISIKNEKRLIEKGAVQYGKTNSMLLSVAHVAFYLCAIAEANIRQATLNTLSITGLVILLFAIVMLFVVIHQLKEIWTVKLYILPEHKINQSFLFKYVRHPNYFLNIIPELIGLSLLCHAQTTACYGLPIYAVLLFVRIRQEEKAMAHLRS